MEQTVEIPILDSRSYVRRLDVPVDDALRMCRVESIGNLDAQIEYCVDLQGFAIDHVPERLPLQQFHRDEGSPIDFIDFIDRTDVRMVQGGRSLRLPLETAESMYVVGEFVGKELQGDVATEFQVFGFKNYPHTATADLAVDAVMRNRLPHGLGRSGHSLDMLGGRNSGVNRLSF